MLCRDAQRPIFWRRSCQLGPGAPRRRTSAANWRKPLAWNNNHEHFFAEHGRRQRVFCASLADVFDNAVSSQWRFDLLRLIMDTPNLDWLLLTKRIGNAEAMLEQAMRALTHGREGWRENYLPNVWLGTTIVNQEEADRDIPKLMGMPAAVRFLSMEPLLGPVDLGPWLWSCCGDYQVGAEYMGQQEQVCCGKPDTREALGWVIVGGESGQGARPMHPNWARELRDQCAVAGVPFLFKQHGEWAPGSGDFGAGRFVTAAVSRDGRVAQGGYDADDYPNGATLGDGWAMVHRAGKAAAGRLLDGRQHDGFPEVTR
ncbi:DUF5131 family protein (plasmid) [Ralstonia syzygii subsp. celebesensis]